MATTKAAGSLTPHGAGRCFDLFSTRQPQVAAAGGSPSTDVISAVKILTLAGYKVHLLHGDQRLYASQSSPQDLSGQAFDAAVVSLLKLSRCSYIVCPPARA